MPSALTTLFRPAGVDEFAAVAFDVGAEREELKTLAAALKSPRAAG